MPLGQLGLEGTVLSRHTLIGAQEVAKRPVTTGGVGDSNVAVLEGLSEGDIIATAGVAFLNDGQEVTLLGEELLRNAP